MSYRFLSLSRTESAWLQGNHRSRRDHSCYYSCFCCCCFALAVVAVVGCLSFPSGSRSNYAASKDQDDTQTCIEPNRFSADQKCLSS